MYLVEAYLMPHQEKLKPIYMLYYRPGYIQKLVRIPVILSRLHYTLLWLFIFFY